MTASLNALFCSFTQISFCTILAVPTLLLEVKIVVWRRNVQAGCSLSQHNCKKYQSKVCSYQFGKEVNTDLARCVNQYTPHICRERILQRQYLTEEERISVLLTMFMYFRGGSTVSADKENAG